LEAGEIPVRSRHCDQDEDTSNWKSDPTHEHSRLNALFQEEFMSHTTLAPTSVAAPIPVGDILPWAIFGGLLMLIAIYFVGTEEGAMALFNGMYVHEFVHDGRHLLGFPCH
jgi:hypothetical protein